MFDKTLVQILSDGLLKLSLEDHGADNLLEYVYLLEKWNKTYNITAIRDLPKMVILHIIDSAAVYRYLAGNSIVDVGTGGGIPGIVLAILNPELNVTLLDSNKKKTRFLRYVKRQLKLDNVRIVCERVEKYHPKTHYDVVISRAFCEVGDYLHLAGHLCGSDGRVYAMKGPRKESEHEADKHGFKLIQDIDIDVPFLDAKRRLLIFSKL
ncbi:16S rRNA (guanine(527)-N(7))-methyltransferase [hydrothermal vent metagenome]|uniref:16S rRNA (Guanine(527)-N(7))-methyltransferase n=1 Tax=hydrothermal vent metagenome TaxID=652676 RepID=A0A3B0V7X2_9ZZZZ